jgi:hypothetical protein
MEPSRVDIFLRTYYMMEMKTATASTAYTVIDMRNRGDSLGPRGATMLETMNSSDRFAYDTERKARGVLDKINMPTLRQAIGIRTDGKFVPLIFLAPPEDFYKLALEDKGALPLRGS